MKPVLLFLFFLGLCRSEEVQQGERLKEPVTELPATEDVYFVPKELMKFKEGTHHIVKWYTTLTGAHRALITNNNEVVSAVSEFEENYDIEEENSNVTGYGYINVTMLFIGYNNFTLTILDENNQTLGETTLPMSVLLAYRQLSLIFVYSIGVLISLVYINMGATLDISVVKQIAKRPVGPLVGIMCQYCLMPVFAFGLAKLYFPDLPLLQLGMFLNGASPGGGQSNIWTYLLGGSLDLSIMMTFVSTLVAFGAVPMWVFSLGPFVVEDTGFTIPYLRIFILVVSLVIPCAIGLAIQFFFPKVAKFIEKYLLTPMAFFNALFIVTFGFYANRYIFAIFNLKILIAAFSLPVLGYLSGLLFAKLARRPWNEVIAIGIETGVQNTNIAVFILKLTLEEPSGDLTVVIPAATAILTPAPLLTAYIIKKIYECFARSDGKDLPKLEDNNDSKQGVQNEAYLGHLTPPVNNKGQDNLSRGVIKRLGIENPAVELRDDRL